MIYSCLSYRIDILHINEDQSSPAAFVVYRVERRSGAAAGWGLDAQRATGADEHGVTQHSMASHEDTNRKLLLELAKDQRKT